MLVLAIGATLILTLIVSTVALNVSGLVDIATNVKQQEQVVWASTSARSRVIYSVLTGHKTLHGFSNASTKPRTDDMGGVIQTPLNSDLRVDGRWYLMNAFPFSIQDQAGLLNANTLSSHEFEQIFAYQLAKGTTTGMLSQQYKDFIDFDDSKRFMGGESFDYAGSNKRGPINRSLFLPKELMELLAWPDSYFPWDILHTEQLVWNINTAPRSVLSIKTAASNDAITRFLAERETDFYTGESSAEKTLGVDTIFQQAESLTAAISAHLRIAFIPVQVCNADDSDDICQFSLQELLELGDYKVELLDLKITPTGGKAPYQVNRVHTTSLLAYSLSRELIFPLSKNGEDAILDTLNKKDATIRGENYSGFVADTKKLLINELIKSKNVPITEYKNQTLPF